MATRRSASLVVSATTASHHCRTTTTVLKICGQPPLFVQRSGGITKCHRPRLLQSFHNNTKMMMLIQACWQKSIWISTATTRRNLWSKSTIEEEEKKLGIISNTSNSNKDDNLDNNDDMILYDRGPGRLKVMRMGFGFSCFNTAYWLWYSTCFVPAVNASPITEITIDPILPSIGIIMSVIIQSIFTLYPRYLISRLTWSPTTNNVTLYTHTVLPWVKADLTKPMKVVPVGELKLDAASKEAKQIVSVYGGDLRRFKGHVGITANTGRQWPPFLLDFSGQATAAATNSSSSSSSSSADSASSTSSKHHHNDVPEPEILFEILLNPQAIIRDFNDGMMVMNNSNRRLRRSSANSDDNDDDPSWRVQVARGAAAHKNKKRTSSSSSSKTPTRQQRESKLLQIAKRRR